MMYVTGETAEPSTEALTMVEEIVRVQVVEMVCLCFFLSSQSSTFWELPIFTKSQLAAATELAARRGSRFISNNDLIFQIRHDTAKVSRLRSFLAWKDVRRNVKDSDDKGGDAELSNAAADNELVGAGTTDDARKNKRAKVGLPWELPASLYTQSAPELDDDGDNDDGSDDDKAKQAILERLRKADEQTKDMTKEEYTLWTEYRRASFTWRKVNRFRDWAGIGTGPIADTKPADDIIDILGFLICEMVRMLTEEALRIKHLQQVGNTLDEKEKEKGISGDPASRGRAATPAPAGLFLHPGEERGTSAPVEPRHIQLAFANLQTQSKKNRAMLNGTRSQTRVRLVSFVWPSTLKWPFYSLVLYLCA
jgi:transcription initiation protein SPT3